MSHPYANCSLKLTQDYRETCLVQLKWDNDSANGFHYGGGWIVTNSHVVGENASRLPRMKILYRLPSGITKELQPIPRLCFYKKAVCGVTDVIDNQVPDIVLFRLENFEMPFPTAINDQTLTPLAVNLSGYYSLNAGDKTFTLWYDKDGELQRSEEEYVTSKGGLFYRSIGNLKPGSSGAPVYSEASRHLVGVHFACKEAKNRSIAVSFSLAFRFLSGQIPCIANAEIVIAMLLNPNIPKVARSIVHEIVSCFIDGRAYGASRRFIKLATDPVADSDDVRFLIEHTVRMCECLKAGIVPVVPQLEGSS